MKRIIMFTLSTIALNSANAGLHAFTMHSRANCINNESISWEYKVERMLGTVSQHFFQGKFVHRQTALYENTWRSAAVHWGEASPTGHDWSVKGYHWQKIGYTEYLIQQTDAVDCNIYDGWWDV